MDDAVNRNAVICVDPIATALFKAVTPDISWEAYVSWLRHRRPDLDVVWLNQPHDWLEIFTRRAKTYEQLVDDMVVEMLSRMNTNWEKVVILGFSLGGLTALRVAIEVARLAIGLKLDYVAFVTIGTPFSGTGRYRDRLLRRLPFDYFKHLFDVETNQRLLKELCLFAHAGRLRVLVGEVERDEIVAPSSALLPLQWLEQWRPTGDIDFSRFSVRNRGALIRNHDGLLYDSQSIAYIDGMVDGLLPPRNVNEGIEYEPFMWKRWRTVARQSHHV